MKLPFFFSFHRYARLESLPARSLNRQHLKSAALLGAFLFALLPT